MEDRRKRRKMYFDPYQSRERREGAIERRAHHGVFRILWIRMDDLLDRAFQALSLKGNQ